MKVSNLPKVLALVAALLLSTGAFASNKGSLQISTAVMVNGKQLAAGEYAVKWEGTGPQVQVTIMKGKNVVATAPAHLVDLNSSPNGDSAVIKKNDDGSNSLAQIRFGGKKKALAIDGVAQSS